MRTSKKRKQLQENIHVEIRDYNHRHLTKIMEHATERACLYNIKTRRLLKTVILCS